MAPDDVCPIDEHSREVLLALQSVIATLIVGLQSDPCAAATPRANATTPSTIMDAGELDDIQGALGLCQTGVPNRIHHEINHCLVHVIDRLIGMLERDGTSRSAEAPITREPAPTDRASVVPSEKEGDSRSEE